MLACIILFFLKLLGWLFYGIFFRISQVININIKKLGVELFIRKSGVITVGYA
jgi:hypothetical protein